MPEDVARVRKARRVVMRERRKVNIGCVQSRRV